MAWQGSNGKIFEGLRIARHTHIDTPRLIAVDLARQLLPGIFEHAVDYLIDHEIDLSGFDNHYRNDATGACAYPPGLMLKVVLFAYNRWLVSSRGIKRAYRERVTFIALSGDSALHWARIEKWRGGVAPFLPGKAGGMVFF